MEWLILIVALIVILGAVYLTVGHDVVRSRWARTRAGNADSAEATKMGTPGSGRAGVEDTLTTLSAPLAPADPMLPPLLLSEDPLVKDIDAVRFSVGFHGYRVEEVDEFLEQARANLARRATPSSATTSSEAEPNGDAQRAEKP